MAREIPSEFDRIRALAIRAIAPLKPADGQTGPFGDRRIEAGNALPPYYLVYLLFVELLGYKNLGSFEKVAWSVPIDFEGKGYLLEHRKLGMGVFATPGEGVEADVARIVSLIRRGVRTATPFFRWMADGAVTESKVNVVNKSRYLFERYEYLRGLYDATCAEAEARKDEQRVEKHVRPNGSDWTTVSYPRFELLEKAEWLSTTAIEAFFSWTEHVFIHLALLQGRITTGAQVAELIGADWGDKFKAALDVSDARTKPHFDRLLVMRRQLRNFIAHGAFGRSGEAFRFHSSAGAIPVVLDYQGEKQRFSLVLERVLPNADAMATIDQFIAFVWTGPREAAKLYIQKAGLPLILTMVNDGRYAHAMASTDAMSDFVDYLGHAFDNASNMDW
jgi:hypothetical protein